ncbi:MAG: serine/threonine protein kinase [Myxococcales bacterium]|nr:serine/threonine protein kinase [Myxococcales bacterium]
MSRAAQGVRRLGEYLLGPVIGSGGMAEIHYAVRRGLGEFTRPLALKVLRPQFAGDPKVLQMFLNEARIVARLDHPNLVQVFDVGCAHGRYYIAMELVRGITLAELIDALRLRRKGCPARLISYIGRSVLEALQHAHEACDAAGRPLGLIHRDVTPHNVLLSTDGRVKLTDFGIAKARDLQGLTCKGTLKGTLEYVSPEQLTARPLDHRVDIYSTSITLLTLATADAVFWRGTVDGTIRAIRSDPLPDLSSVRPDVPVALAAALVRAAQRDRERRFPTAASFGQALPPVDHSCMSDLARLVRALYRPPALPARGGESPSAEPSAPSGRELPEDVQEVPTVPFCGEENLARRRPRHSAVRESRPGQSRRRKERPLWSALLMAVLLFMPAVEGESAEETLAEPARVEAAQPAETASDGRALAFAPGSPPPRTRPGFSTRSTRGDRKGQRRIAASAIPAGAAGVSVR